MGKARSVKRAVVLAAIAIGASGWAGARAHGLAPGFLLTCENGRTYPIHARAVTVDGDLVTGTISTGRGRTHVRLIPMGAGYRYAGRGLWVDGLRTEAVLHFGPSKAVACTVTHE
jgi:hypothetical protein